ncbi:MAG: biotin carboxylase N-terminal domain-containing protein, partial [Candidatus Sericytochromatia bacterium]
MTKVDNRIRRLGIVNRGEPAVRALTAVAELNARGPGVPPACGAERSDRGGTGNERIETVVLYTDADADSWFVREADIAVPLGQRPSACRLLEAVCVEHL